MHHKPFINRFIWRRACLYLYVKCGRIVSGIYALKRFNQSAILFNIGFGFCARKIFQYDQKTIEPQKSYQNDTHTQRTSQKPHSSDHPIQRRVHTESNLSFVNSRQHLLTFIPGWVQTSVISVIKTYVCTTTIIYKHTQINHRDDRRHRPPTTYSLRFLRDVIKKTTMVNEEMTVPSSSYTSSPMNENGYNNDDDDCFMMEDNVDVDHDDGPPPQPSTPSSSSSSSSCDHISGMDDTFKNSNDVTSNERSSVSPMDDGIDTVVVFQNNNNKLRQSNRNNRTNGRTTNRILIVLQWFGSFVRILVLDVPLTVLFASFIFVVGIQHISNKYFIPQIELMSYITTKRELEDSTYYRRHCTTEDVSATSLAPLQLLSGRDTPDSAIEKMLTHGVVTFPERLLSKETCDAARAFIVAENDIHPHQWGLLAGANRHAWGIDMNMDPSIKQIWKELSSNRLFVESVEAIVGKDPAVVEFTAITAKYGAKSQKDHADVMNGASATQQARSFLTSYSLFIPLQDTTKDMGATSICPGTHLCNEGASDACYDGHRNIVMTGEKEFDDDDDDDDNLVLETGNTTTSAQMKMKSPPVWEQGTGMMYNQQVIHKGRAHTQVDGPDRVILILTFAPRPTTSRGGLETRIIPLREL